MWGRAISWPINPMNSIVISINHSYWSYKPWNNPHEYYSYITTINHRNSVNSATFLWRFTHHVLLPGGQKHVFCPNCCTKEPPEGRGQLLNVVVVHVQNQEPPTSDGEKNTEIRLGNMTCLNGILTRRKRHDIKTTLNYNHGRCFFKIKSLRKHAVMAIKTVIERTYNSYN